MEEAQRWAVMILAHNEEQRIVACLDSLFDGEPGHEFEAYVMANGCTDRTEELVRAYARQRPAVRLVTIALGDKCNAWNAFVHETVPSACPDREVYFFMDGDARIAPGSLSALAHALETDAYAHAASAVPGSGRSMRKNRQVMLQERGLVANLYALRGTFVRRLRDRGVRLPLKLEGDDGLVGALVKWDLDPRGLWDNRRIHPCADARFLFESVPIASFGEWRKYWRRLVRYGRAHYEFQLLGPILRERGIGALPPDIQQIYGGAAQLRPAWRGIYSPAFAVALWQMRAIARAAHRAASGSNEIRDSAPHRPPPAPRA